MDTKSGTVQALRGPALSDDGVVVRFGFGAAAHMLAFSAAADVVKVELIGTSAAIVNGAMFLVSGLLIARPGQLAERFAAQAAAAPELASALRFRSSSRWW